MEKFAERLKDLRTEKELSQIDVARATGVSQNAIAQWENVKRIPNAQAVITLADFFCVTTAYLLGRGDI